METPMWMTPEERRNWLEHLEMRGRQEEERQKALIEDNKAYKRRLIEDILRARPGVWTREQLASRSVSYLERIA